MARLNRNHVTRFANSLREQRAALVDRLRAELDAGPGQPYADVLDGTPGDAADVAAKRLLADLDHSRLEHDLKDLQEIDAALAHVADESYGNCIDCGEPIGIDRLRARPTALRCVECQGRFEAAQRSIPRP